MSVFVQEREVGVLLQSAQKTVAGFLMMLCSPVQISNPWGCTASIAVAMSGQRARGRVGEVGGGTRETEGECLVLGDEVLRDELWVAFHKYSTLTLTVRLCP